MMLGANRAPKTKRQEEFEEALMKSAIKSS